MGKNPTDRGKNGTKKSVLVEGDGGPLGCVIDRANVPDCKLLKATIEAIVVERPEVTAQKPQHLCLDKGYFGRPSERCARQFGYIPHIRSRGEEQRRCRGRERARRWVVEAAHSWTNRARRLLVRWEKKPDNYLGFVHLQFAFIALNRTGVLG